MKSCNPDYNPRGERNCTRAPLLPLQGEELLQPMRSLQPLSSTSPPHISSYFHLHPTPLECSFQGVCPILISPSPPSQGRARVYPVVALSLHIFIDLLLPSLVVWYFTVCFCILQVVDGWRMSWVAGIVEETLPSIMDDILMVDLFFILLWIA